MAKLVDKYGVIDILGIDNPNWPYNRVRIDSNFPRPIQGGDKFSKGYWLESDILKFKKTFKFRCKIEDQEPESTLCNGMAQEFIRLAGRYWKISSINWQQLV